MKNLLHYCSWIKNLLCLIPQALLMSDMANADRQIHVVPSNLEDFEFSMINDLSLLCCVPCIPFVALHQKVEGRLGEVGVPPHHDFWLRRPILGR